MPRPAKVTRVSQATREKIIKAASRAFALNGYEGASVRTIVAEAQVNQAAINYHFGSKEGLYRAVLETALRALMSEDAPQRPGKLSREAQLRRFVRRQGAAPGCAGSPGVFRYRPLRRDGWRLCRSVPDR